jgi:GMP synthase (glutamine-hydrolysing)
MRRSILIIKCGSADRTVVARFGDYESWFIRALGGDPSHFTVIAPYKGEPLPDPTRYAAVIATGSPFSVTERRPWMASTGEYLVKAGEKQVPVLGVCFGHQLLAETLGAPIQKSPRGREFGAVEVELTAEGQRDPLFRGLPARFKVLETHEDEVPSLPTGATLLAGNLHSPIQAFSVGAWVRGVQFHPELWSDPARTTAETRRIPVNTFSLEETPAGKTVLRNFNDHFVAPRAE